MNDGGWDGEAWVAPDGVTLYPEGDAPMTPLDHFLSGVKSGADVIELGTLQSIPGRSTHHRAWVPDARSFTMVDIEAGADVDVVADAHALGFPERFFDAYIACSVYEHLSRPWIAAHEAARVLRTGGMAYVQTHQTFPIHGYPSDFWRYTVEALTLIFDDAGLDVVAADYEFPCQIVPTEPLAEWNDLAEAFLNVNLTARQPL